MTITNQSHIDFDTILPDGGTTPGSEDSNIVSTEIITYSFTKVKSTEKPTIHEGETSTQTVILNNTSNFNLTNLSFNDTMTDGATYVNGSVTIDGISYPNFDLIAGFPLPNINANESTTITYQVIANNPKTSSPVINHGTVNYTATDPVIGSVNFTENTNDVLIEILANDFDVVKNVNTLTAKVGDTLHYTTTIKNNGDNTLTNLTFVDNLVNGLQFVNGSVKINGTNFPNLNPNISFSIPDLNSGVSNIVEFDVLILNTAGNVVTNFSTILVSNENPNNSNTVTTTIIRVTPPIKPKPIFRIRCGCCPCQNANCCNFQNNFNRRNCMCNLFRCFNRCNNNFRGCGCNQNNCFNNFNNCNQCFNHNICHQNFMFNHNNCNCNNNCFNNCNRCDCNFRNPFSF